MTTSKTAKTAKSTIKRPAAIPVVSPKTIRVLKTKASKDPRQSTPVPSAGLAATDGGAAAKRAARTKAAAMIPQCLEPVIVAAPEVTPQPSQTAQDEEMREVTLVCMAQNAGSVSVAGSFDDWNPQAHPMARVADATFQATLRLSPGEYRYKFVVDGQWLEDPNAAAQAPNPHGTLDSVLRV